MGHEQIFFWWTPGPGKTTLYYTSTLNCTGCFYLNITRLTLRQVRNICSVFWSMGQDLCPLINPSRFDIFFRSTLHLPSVAFSLLHVRLCYSICLICGRQAWVPASCRVFSPWSTLTDGASHTEDPPSNQEHPYPSGRHVVKHVIVFNYPPPSTPAPPHTSWEVHKASVYLFYFLK